MNGFDKVIGYEEIKAELHRYADVLKSPEIYKKHGVFLPGGILLYGEPGVGKTLMAECFIEETNRKSFTIRKDKPDGDFVSYITNTFEEASKEDISIVFLDDMDKFANEDENHSSTEEYVTIQSCIDKYQEKGVFVIATVNDFDLLPVSLTRSGRLDKKYEMIFPKGEDAEKILQGFLSNYKVSDDIDVHELSRLMSERSCADYKEVVNEASIRAIFEGRDEIGNDDIVKSFFRMMCDAPECVKSVSPILERVVAVHEAGHTVIGEILRPGSITAVTIVRHVNDNGGMAFSYSPYEYPLLTDYCDYRIMRGLGGKAATEVIFGASDMGCKSDLRSVIDYLGRWIENFCYKGFDVFWHRDQSAGMIERKEKKVTEELERYYQKTKQILIENRAFLDAVVVELLEKKTLTSRDIARIKQGIEANKIDEYKNTLYHTVCNMVDDPDRLIDVLGDKVRCFSKETNGYWEDVESKGKKYMILYLEEGDYVRSTDDLNKNLSKEDVICKFPIIDGIQYRSNDGSHKLIYMEV